VAGEPAITAVVTCCRGSVVAGDEAVDCAPVPGAEAAALSGCANARGDSVHACGRCDGSDVERVNAIDGGAGAAGDDDSGAGPSCTLGVGFFKCGGVTSRATGGGRERSVARRQIDRDMNIGSLALVACSSMFAAICFLTFRFPSRSAWST